MGFDTVELVMEIESEFGISIPESGERLKTVGETWHLILELMGQSRSESKDVPAILESEKQLVWLKLRKIVARFFEMPEGTITESTRYVEDLGVS